MLILGGLSLGPIVQVPLLCAQNAVTIKDMAVTSSTMNFWQSIGGLFGTAIMQTLLNNKISSEMVPVTAELEQLQAAMGGGGGGGGGSGGTLNVQALYGLPAPFNDLYDKAILAFTRACTQVFWCALAGGCLALAAALCMQHIPLKGGEEHKENEAAGKQGGGLKVRMVIAH